MKSFYFFFNDTATTEIYTLSYTTLFRSPEQASWPAPCSIVREAPRPTTASPWTAWSSRRACTERSEEHTSELQSQSNLVCRLLLEKKNKHVPAKFRNRAGRQLLAVRSRQ